VLTIWGDNQRYCDGVTRRDFLKIGAFGAGLALPDLLRQRASAGSAAPKSTKSAIMIYLGGGPSHIDMYDLKPNAPPEVRGEFKPIRTRVPGFDICELFPLQAQISDQLAVVRTVKFTIPNHELRELYTGYPQPLDRPCFGSVISRFRGNPANDMPRYVSLDPKFQYDLELESPRYLGSAHAPFHLGYKSGQEVKNLSLAADIKGERFASRKQLLASLDTLRRDMDSQAQFAGADTFTAQALDMITSARAREAFDLSREPEKVRRRYGDRDSKYAYVGKSPDTAWDGEKFLLARRLVEAGVSVVSLRIGSWDHHGDVIQSQRGVSIWHSLRTVLPLLDRSIHALVTDLRERGLDNEVLVLVWGEFGRTPKIWNTGRDHWSEVGCALLSGGGMKMGQVIGETDSQAAHPRNRPVGCQNVIATVYHALGIDPAEKVPDFSGRPQYLLDDREPIRELVC
jgi:hypothetical protein